jgi:hypothetical protein
MKIAELMPGMFEFIRQGSGDCATTAYYDRLKRSGVAPTQ